MNLRNLTLAIVFTLTIILPGFSQKTLSKIIKKGEIRIGTSANQPPYTMRSKEGTIIGFEVDIAEALAESMGVKLQLVELPFAELLPSLQKGDIDAIMSGMTITPGRNLAALFAGPYSFSGKSILTRSDVLAKISEAEEANDSKYKIAFLKGSTSERFVQMFMEDAEDVPVANYDEGVKMVLDNKADALVADYPICLISALKYGNDGLVTLDQPLTMEPIGMALPAGDVQFHNLIDNYLNTLAITGSLKVLETYWFEGSSWLIELE